MQRQIWTASDQCSHYDGGHDDDDDDGYGDDGDGGFGDDDDDGDSKHD